MPLAARLQAGALFAPAQQRPTRLLDAKAPRVWGPIGPAGGNHSKVRHVVRRASQGPDEGECGVAACRPDVVQACRPTPPQPTHRRRRQPTRLLAHPKAQWQPRVLRSLRSQAGRPAIKQPANGLRASELHLRPAHADAARGPEEGQLGREDLEVVRRFYAATAARQQAAAAAAAGRQKQQPAAQPQADVTVNSAVAVPVELASADPFPGTLPRSAAALCFPRAAAADFWRAWPPPHALTFLHPALLPCLHLLPGCRAGA